MDRSISRVGAAIGAALLIVAVTAAPALACGGLIGPNGAVNLLRTTTLAAYHDGAEHYVTAFQFAGGGGAFGSLTPLPGIPSSVEKGGDWTLQRLVRETDPLPEFDAVRAAAPAAAGSAEELMKVRIDALDVTVLRGGAAAVGQWATEHGFRLPPDAPEVLDFYAERSPIFLAAVFDADAAAARGQAVGDGTPVHVTIPTDNPWVPLRILALGKTAAERVDASVYLLTDRRPALLPVPTGDNGLGLDHSAPATASLLDDLRCRQGDGLDPGLGLADQGLDRRRGARSLVRPRDRRVGGRGALADHGRARPARHDRRTGSCGHRHPAHRRAGLRRRGDRRHPGRQPATPAAVDGLTRDRPMTDHRRPGRLSLVGGIALSLGLAGIAAAWTYAPDRAPDAHRDRDPLLALHAGSSDGRGGRAGHVRAAQRRPDRPRMDRRRRRRPRAPPDRHGAGPRLAPDRGLDPGRVEHARRPSGSTRRARTCTSATCPGTRPTGWSARSS